MANLLEFTQLTRKAIVNRRNAIGLANSSGWLALAIHSKQAAQFTPQIFVAIVFMKTRMAARTQYLIAED